MKRLVFALVVTALFLVASSSGAFADGWPSCC